MITSIREKKVLGIILSILVGISGCISTGKVTIEESRHWSTPEEEQVLIITENLNVTEELGINHSILTDLGLPFIISEGDKDMKLPNPPLSYQEWNSTFVTTAPERRTPWNESLSKAYTIKCSYTAEVETWSDADGIIIFFEVHPLYDFFFTYNQTLQMYDFTNVNPVPSETRDNWSRLKAIYFYKNQTFTGFSVTQIYTYAYGISGNQRIFYWHLYLFDIHYQLQVGVCYYGLATVAEPHPGSLD